MNCKFCGCEMVLDDVDFNFKGNKDNYWLCNSCGSSALEKIRYGKTVNVQFNKINDDYRTK